MGSWTLWLVLAAPLLGVAVVAWRRQFTWTQALAAAIAAGLLAMAVSLWRAGLQVHLTGSQVAHSAGRPSAVDYAVALGYAAVYAAVLGAGAVGILRALGWPR